MAAGQEIFTRGRPPIRFRALCCVRQTREGVVSPRRNSNAKSDQRVSKIVRRFSKAGDHVFLYPMFRKLKEQEEERKKMRRKEKRRKREEKKKENKGEQESTAPPFTGPRFTPFTGLNITPFTDLNITRGSGSGAAYQNLFFFLFFFSLHLHPAIAPALSFLLRFRNGKKHRDPHAVVSDRIPSGPMDSKNNFLKNSCFPPLVVVKKYDKK